MAKLKSLVLLIKLVTIILGIAVLSLGLYSHFSSYWTKDIPTVGGETMKPYELCKPLKHFKFPRPCPSIAMEHYFISVIIICFIFSLAVLVPSNLADCSSGHTKFFDMGFHAVASVILLVAGILYIISAVQIDNLFGSNAATNNDDWIQFFVRITIAVDNDLRELLGSNTSGFTNSWKSLLEMGGNGTNTVANDWKRTEKLAAGGLTIVQAFAYGCVAVVIGVQ